MQWIKWAFVSLMLFATYRSDAQQIKLGEGDIDFLHMPFNQDFIARNKIAQIEVTEQIKRSNQPITPTGLRKKYLFNDEGACTSRSTYRNRYGRVDTILEAYQLSAKDEVLQYRRKDRSGFHKEEFEFKGDTMSICAYKGRDKDSIATWISCEHHITRKRDSIETTVIYNEQFLPYLERRKKFDSRGYLMSMTETYLVSRKSQITRYQYNNHGRLSFRSKATKSGSEEWSYIYSDEGLLEEVLFRRDGELVWKRAVVIDDYGRISALLTIDTATEDIFIERFTYEMR